MNQGIPRSSTFTGARIWVQTDVAKALISNGEYLPQGWAPRQQDGPTADQGIWGWATSLVSVFPDIHSSSFH